MRGNSKLWHPFVISDSDHCNAYCQIATINFHIISAISIKTKHSKRKRHNYPVPQSAWVTIDDKQHKWRIGCILVFHVRVMVARNQVVQASLSHNHLMLAVVVNSWVLFMAHCAWRRHCDTLLLMQLQLWCSSLTIRTEKISSQAALASIVPRLAPGHTRSPSRQGNSLPTPANHLLLSVAPFFYRWL